MKRTYLFLHILFIPIYLLFTYFAFVMFLPSYLIVVFVGFDLLQRLIKKSILNKYFQSIIVGIAQTLLFLLLVIIEFKLFNLPLNIEQFKLIATFGSIFLFAFTFISIITTLAYQNTNVLKNVA